MSGPVNEWTKPQTIISVVVLGTSFVTFWTSFDGRLTKAETAQAQAERRLERIEDKLDRLIERSLK